MRLRVGEIGTALTGLVLRKRDSRERAVSYCVTLPSLRPPLTYVQAIPRNNVFSLKASNDHFNRRNTKLGGAQRLSRIKIGQRHEKDESRVIWIKSRSVTAINGTLSNIPLFFSAFLSFSKHRCRNVVDGYVNRRFSFCQRWERRDASRRFPFYLIRYVCEKRASDSLCFKVYRQQRVVNDDFDVGILNSDQIESLLLFHSIDHDAQMRIHGYGVAIE